MTRALPVHALRDVDRDLLAEGIGGKAEALADLARAGLPVPRAWVVPATAHVQLLRTCGLLDAARRGEHAHVARALRDAPLPWTLPPLAPRLAVRSSAADEDREGSARAGRYRSVLEVPPEGLADALRTVWASWHEARADAPVGAPEAPAMAVLLVEMVDPRAAGVLFTVNPLTGSWAEMVVEACHGLGEALVSGAVVPDRYLVRRPRGTLARRLPGPVLARALAWGGETIVAQERELARLPGGGTAWRATEAPGARKLARETLLALCRLGLRVERLRGGPQDIEWALDQKGVLVLLQARPITARASLPRGGSTVWTRRFLGERWPDGATPLGWSVLEPVLTRFVAYPATATRHLGGDGPFRVIRGHPYVNTTVFRHLAFKLPGAPPPRFMLDLLPPEEEAAWVRRAAAAPDLRVYASILRETWAERRWERFRWNPLTNPTAWGAFLEGLPADLARLEAAPAERALATALPILERYVGIHVTSLLFANLGWEVLGPQLGPDAETLLQPPSGSVTARVNAELRALGAIEDERSARAALTAFLHAHGHRSGASWELWSPRWAEDPEGVLRIARAMATRRIAARETHADDEVERTLAALPRGLRAATILTRTYLRLREEQRYNLDRVLWALKRKLRTLGARWLENPDDTRLLRAEELDLAVAGHLDAASLRAIVAGRAAEPIDPAPPDFLVGDAALPVPTVGGARLQGLGISPGLARGRVRVVRGPDEAASLLPGEILVARATDPGWTPLFDRAAGLILELGSQLSHGAIVARELRLPAVANLTGATAILRNGEEVTLDGRAGVVWRHAPDGGPG